jgi:hypothetical protein
MHNINIQDSNSNWTHWGNLVKGWIDGTITPRPTTVGQLRTAMTGAGVIGTVKGDPARGVTLVDYNPVTGPIIIPLPTKEMVEIDEDLLVWISMRPSAYRQYPLPTFYAVAFGNAAMVPLTQSELLEMGRRRLGEYVVNECM